MGPQGLQSALSRPGLTSRCKASKVLFVCWANINRSQIAESIFNGLAEGDRAISAGISPRRAGVLVRNEHNNPFLPMCERGYDLSKARVKRLDRKAADSAGKVVLIFGRNHLKDVPDYLLRRPDIELWDVGSISDQTSFKEYCRLERKRIATIERRVRGLLRRLEPHRAKIL